MVLALMDWGMHRIPPGPQCFKISSVINPQKVGTLLYLSFLMWYFGNFSDVMCLYTAMHGSYGLLWYMKHLTCPDKSYDRLCTFNCAVVCWVLLLGPYMVPGYLLASGQCYLTKDSTDLTLPREPSLVRKYGSLFMYIIGVCLTISSDVQKNTMIKHMTKRPLLITDGLFSRTRNANYLGEMLLYGSFAVLTNHRLSYAIVLFAYLSIFPARIFQKEMSLRQKPGFEAYSERSNLFLPRVCGLNDWQMVVAVAAVLGGVWRSI